VQSASRVFKGLAYKRFHHVPLYLEYAPEDVFEEAHQPGTKPEAQKPLSIQGTAVEAPVDPPASGVEDSGTSTTLYIKNISFETKQAALEDRCSKVAVAAGGFLRSLKIPKKSGPNNRELLQGYAFAEFSDTITAQAAKQRLLGVDLDGHKLHVEMSKKDTSSGRQAATVRSFCHHRTAFSCMLPANILWYNAGVAVCYKCTWKPLPQTPSGDLRTCRSEVGKVLTPS
jgi:multiple RNA-binding domain-containing protein 1